MTYCSTSFLPRKWRQILRHYYAHTDAVKLVRLRYRERFGEEPNLNDPQTLNEKILWLMLFTDISDWTPLADKYLVREYVRECGLGHLLNELYAVWDSAGAIDLDDPRLPDSFVLKSNNGCGDAIFVHDRKCADRKTIHHRMKRALRRKFGRKTAERHYLSIRPLILAERLLPRDSALGSSLVDYKFFCFDGNPRYCMVCYDHRPNFVRTALYDAHTWENLGRYVTGKYYDPEQREIPRPASLGEMLAAAEKLAGGGRFPQVRVDFYEVGGKPVFGEMTFASAAGMDTGFTREFQEIMGSQVTLPALAGALGQLQPAK